MMGMYLPLCLLRYSKNVLIFHMDLSMTYRTMKEMSETTDYGKICYWCGQHKDIHTRNEWEEHNTEWKRLVKEHGARSIFWKRAFPSP